MYEVVTQVGGDVMVAHCGLSLMMAIRLRHVMNCGLQPGEQGYYFRRTPVNYK
jgi:hypothetical protein